MDFSIIIVCRQEQEAQRCIEACNKLHNPDYEIILETGNDLPGVMRNRASKRAKGDYLAFIDADAYPDPFWLNYKVPGVAGWCGPGLLPPNATWKEKAHDLILKYLPFSYRVKMSKRRYVTDYPSFNLIIKKSIFEQFGGFPSTLTGEDSDLCTRITDKGLLIAYIPWCVVYHDRRKTLYSFLKQTAIYSARRGDLFKKGLGNSRKLVYALPSICLLFILWWVIYSLFSLTQ